MELYGWHCKSLWPRTWRSKLLGLYAKVAKLPWKLWWWNYVRYFQQISCEPENFKKRGCRILLKPFNTFCTHCSFDNLLLADSNFNLQENSLFNTVEMWFRRKVIRRLRLSSTQLSVQVVPWRPPGGAKLPLSAPQLSKHKCRQYFKS